MVLPIVLLVLAALVTLWVAAAVTGLFFALLPAAIVGLLAGWAAGKLTGMRLSLGWTILVGIAGSWLGSALFALVLPRIALRGLFNPLHLVADVLGAAILLVFARAVARPSLTGVDRPRLSRY